MADKNKGRKLSFSFIMTALLSLMGLSIIAVAVILPQLTTEERTNEFEPAKAEIQIAENDSEPAVTAAPEITMQKNDSEGTYSISKKVELTGTKTDQYVKAALIPQWYDSDGRLCGGLGDISNFGIAKEPDTTKNIQQCVSLENENLVILTYYLAPEWDKYWYYDKNTGFYHYRSALKKGQTTKPLILKVEIASNVYELSKEYELRIDVLTDSIQTTADAKTIRAFGRETISN